MTDEYRIDIEFTDATKFKCDEHSQYQLLERLKDKNKNREAANLSGCDKWWSIHSGASLEAHNTKPNTLILLVEVRYGGLKYLRLLVELVKLVFSGEIKRIDGVLFDDKEEVDGNHSVTFRADRRKEEQEEKKEKFCSVHAMAAIPSSSSNTETGSKPTLAEK